MRHNPRRGTRLVKGYSYTRLVMARSYLRLGRRVYQWRRVRITVASYYRRIAAPRRYVRLAVKAPSPEAVKRARARLAAICRLHLRPPVHAPPALRRPAPARRVRRKRPPAPPPLPPPPPPVRVVPEEIEEVPEEIEELPEAAISLLADSDRALIDFQKTLPRGRWVSADAYLDSIREALRSPGMESFKINDPIYHSTRDAALVSTDDLLVWDRAISGRTLADLEMAPAFLVIRVWGLLFNANTGEYHVFSRSRAFGHRKQLQAGDPPGYVAPPAATDYEGALAWAKDIFEDLKEWSRRRNDYGEVIGDILAWTFWGPLEYAPGGKTGG